MLQSQHETSYHLMSTLWATVDRAFLNTANSGGPSCALECRKHTRLSRNLVEFFALLGCLWGSGTKEPFICNSCSHIVYTTTCHICMLLHNKHFESSLCEHKDGSLKHALTYIHTHPHTHTSTLWASPLPTPTLTPMAI